jgi:hypothetical protein
MPLAINIYSLMGNQFRTGLRVSGIDVESDVMIKLEFFWYRTCMMPFSH